MAMTLDMYAAYIAEREGRGLVKHEDGFATYKQLDEASVYLIDIYVVPEKRREGVGKLLLEMVTEQALQLGATQLLGSVDITTAGVTESLKVILASGFVFSHAKGNGVYFLKQIKGV